MFSLSWLKSSQHYTLIVFLNGFVLFSFWLIWLVPKWAYVIMNFLLSTVVVVVLGVCGLRDLPNKSNRLTDSLMRFSFFFKLFFISFEIKRQFPVFDNVLTNSCIEWALQQFSFVLVICPKSELLWFWIVSFTTSCFHRSWANLWRRWKSLYYLGYMSRQWTKLWS